MDANTVDVLRFYVNGKKISDRGINPEWTLLFYLRNKLRLCGTKLGCAEGGCGACTVMVSKYDRERNKVLHLAVNACLAPVCSMHGLAVTTVEGIGSTKTRLHPVQERIAKAHGSQCGFCTPGIVMSMYTLLRNMPKPSIHDLETTFQGNLCRCTGYRPIIEGYKTFTEEWEREQQKFTNATPPSQLNGACGMGDKCCKKVGGGSGCGTENSQSDEIFKRSEFTPYDPSQEPIFPPDIKLNPLYDQENLVFKGPNVTWFRPTSINQLVALKSQYPDAKIIVGNTEVGVEVKFKHFLYPVLIQPNQIAELASIQKLPTGLQIGASVTLQDMETAMKTEIKTLPEYRTRIFKAIVEMLNRFAGKQIRNVATVGGNLMTCSPISDLNPIFTAANCVIELLSSRGSRKIIINEHFYTGYRKNIVDKVEIMVSILIPYSTENQYFCAYKQAKRRDDDIAIVNAAIYIEIRPETKTIEDIRMAFGGMAPTTVLALKTREKLIGMKWGEDILEIAYKNLLDDLPLTPSAPGGMIQYRRALTLSLFFKAYLFFSENYNLNGKHVLNKEVSGSTNFDFILPQSSQYFAMNPNLDHTNDTVGRPLVHAAAYQQATGEAIYCDDIPTFKNELYLAFVLSTKAHARITKIDPTEALAMNGVHAFFSAKDLPDHQNRYFGANHQELFASELVLSQGLVIGTIVAEDQITAQRSARMVRVEYEELTPIIITLEDAIEKNSIFPEFPVIIKKGDVPAVFKDAEYIIEGECRSGGQEHFYMETHAAIAVPKLEEDEMEIYCSTQNCSHINKLVARILGVPINRIVTKVKRIGGGFGGKESGVIPLVTALAAHRLGRPVRCMFDRDEDMLMTGGRHPFLSKYKVAFSKDGKITALETDIYNNGGCLVEMSKFVLLRALHHIENAYAIPNVLIRGYVCRTNLPSNTAFRGFGGPQAMFVAENIIRDIANKLEKDPLEIMQINLFQEGDLTPYNQVVSYCTLSRCVEECLQMANYPERFDKVSQYNRQNRWKKRGLSVVPTMFGIGFHALFLNQAGALIHVYTDGSVLLSHGGVEMGQGLHTKMLQVASRALGVSITKIHISETSTDKVPNTSSTAASICSDMNGMAVLNACQVILERLRPYKEKNPNGTWEEWVTGAYFDRISLSSTGFYKVPIEGHNWETNTGAPFNYFTFGCAVSEVEVDCLTGDHRVLRTDIVMDIGESINPAIDIGQVEGAFMQGQGFFTLEELVYSPTGDMFSRGPGAYKIPAFSDIPLEFNVSLLKGAPNPRAIYSSKAVGEPPLFLASSVFFAIKEAIKSARIDAGVEPHFRLDSPATAARIRMACIDHFTSMLDEAEPGSFTPWNVIP